MSIDHDDFMQAQSRITDLETEIARLQEQVVKRHGSDCIVSWEEARAQRDGWEALAKVREETLERTRVKWLTVLVFDASAPITLEGLALAQEGVDEAEAAIAMTPEEARERAKP